MDDFLQLVTVLDDNKVELSNILTFPSFSPWVATTRVAQNSDTPEASLYDTIYH